MKLEVTVSIGLVGCERTITVDVPDEDLEGLDETMRSQHLDEIAFEASREAVCIDWKEAKRRR